MSRKLSFQKIKHEEVYKLNVALDIQFATKAELDRLKKERQKINKKISSPATTGEEMEKLQRDLNVISDKSKNVRSYMKKSLFGYKDGKTVVEGIYDSLSAGCDLYAAYVNSMASEKTNALATYICKEVLHNTFGMDSSVDKLCMKLANYLSDSIKGRKINTDKSIIKGELVKERTANDICGTFVNALATYAARTNLEVCVPTIGTHNFKIEYNSLDWTVSGYSVTEKTE